MNLAAVVVSSVCLSASKHKRSYKRAQKMQISEVQGANSRIACIDQSIHQCRELVRASSTREEDVYACSQAGPAETKRAFLGFD